MAAVEVFQVEPATGGPRLTVDFASRPDRRLWMRVPPAGVEQAHDKLGMDADGNPYFDTHGPAAGDEVILRTVLGNGEIVMRRV